MSTLDPKGPSAEQLGSRLEFETLISDTSAALFAARPEQLDPVVERCLERVRLFFEVDRCALLAVSPDQQVVNVRLASYADGLERVPPELNLRPAFPWSYHRLFVERKAIRLSSPTELPSEAAIERESWAQMPIRSALTIPIQIGGNVSHIVVLNTVNHERKWPAAFVTRLRVLGALLASALEKQEVFARLREAEVRVQSAADLAGLAFYEVNFAESTVSVDDRFRELCGVPPDQEHGLGALEFWKEHLHPDDRARVMDTRQQLHDARQERVSIEYRFLHPVHGVRWMEHLGCVSERDATGRAVVTFGVLRDVTERKRVEDELRDLSRRLILAHEEERALLARELHDDVTQRLAALAIDLRRAEHTAPEGALAEAMQAVREELTRLSEDVHSLAYQLHPSILEELGLRDALRTECERQSRTGKLEVSVEFDAPPDNVGKDAAICLFRVAQEALSNVARHSGARAAKVTLRHMDGGLILAVADDGVGFDPENRGTARTLGLVSMRERVRLVEGTLDIESASGQGTTIVAWVPADRE